MEEKDVNEMRERMAEEWKPKTQLGKDVLQGKISSIETIFKEGKKIMEPEIVDFLIPNIGSEVILIGGTPGKGGGIRRTAGRRTSRMHKSGRRYKITSMSVVGNSDGYVGLGTGQSSDFRDAIEKSVKKAKLNLIPIKRGCGSWECGCGENHSIPYEIEGKVGSCKVVLKPAPKGLGLCASDSVKKILSLAGIKDIWVKSFGQTGTRINHMKAVFNALKNLNKIKH